MSLKFTSIQEMIELLQEQGNENIYLWGINKYTTILVETNVVEFHSSIGSDRIEDMFQSYSIDEDIPTNIFYADDILNDNYELLYEGDAFGISTPFKENHFFLDGAIKKMNESKDELRFICNEMSDNEYITINKKVVLLTPDKVWNKNVQQTALEHKAVEIQPYLLYVKDNKVFIGFDYLSNKYKKSNSWRMV